MLALRTTATIRFAVEESLPMSNWCSPGASLVARQSLRIAFLRESGASVVSSYRPTCTASVNLLAPA